MPKTKAPQDPPGRVSEAFAYYYSLQHERTLKKVSDKCSVSLSTLKKWSSVYNWKSNVLKLDLDVAARVRDKLLDQAANRTIENLKIIDRLRVRFVGMLERTLQVDGKVIQEDEAGSIIEGMSDFDRLVKLELLLMEKPTAITEEHGKYIVISAVPSSKPEAKGYE